MLSAFTSAKFRSVVRHYTTLALMLALLAGSFVAAPETAFAATETLILRTAGLGSWTAPAGVTSVQIAVWAGGGGGGGTGAAGNGGGGGAGGGYARETAFSVTPGNSYTYYIGRGGNGGNGTNNGSPGEDSMFNASSTVLAVGGPGGASLANGRLRTRPHPVRRSRDELRETRYLDRARLSC